MLIEMIKRVLIAFHPKNFTLEETCIEKYLGSSKGSIPIYLLRNFNRIDISLIGNALEAAGLPGGGEIIDLKRGLFFTFIQFFKRLFFLKSVNPYERLRTCLDQGSTTFLPLHFTEKSVDTSLNCLRSKKMLNVLINYHRQKNHPLSIFPVFIVWGKRPTGGRLNLLDLVFGPDNNPGFFRKIYKLLYIRKKHAVMIGDPVILDEANGQTIELDLLVERVSASITSERKVIYGPPMITGEDVVRKLLKDRYILSYISANAGKDRKKIRVLRKQGRKILREIAADIRYRHVEWASSLLNLVWNNIYDGIQISSSDLSKLRNAAKRGPIILAPSHKSHTDYLLISYLMHINNIVVPHIAAGINLSFFPMGYLFRSMGAYFLRRSFKDDEFYKILLERYIAFLLKHGFPQEFFIEGTRSRTGKIEKPKMGFISFVVKSLAKGACKEVLFVPISIGYEKIIEEASYLRENVGQEKKKEKTLDLLKLGNILKKQYGRVYITIGEPVSTADFIDPKMLPGERRRFIDENLLKINSAIATTLVDRINKEVVVSATFLFSLIILDQPKRGKTLEEILYYGYLLLEILRKDGVTLSKELENLETGMILAAKTFDSSTIESFRFRDQEIFKIREQKHRLTLNYYKNIIIFHFLPYALGATIIDRTFRLKYENARATVDNFIDDFCTLVELFGYDFTLPEGQGRIALAEQVLDSFVRLELVRIDETRTIDLKKLPQLEFLARIITPYFETLYLIQSFCSTASKGQIYSEKNLLSELIGYANYLQAKGILEHCEAATSINFKNALNLFLERGEIVIEQIDKKTKNYRMQFTSKTGDKLEQILAVHLGMSDTFDDHRPIPEGFDEIRKTGGSTNRSEQWQN